MEIVFEIIKGIVSIVLTIVFGLIIVVGILYLTGVIEVHHLVAIPGVFERYQIYFAGNEIYSCFVGNVTSF